MNDLISRQGMCDSLNKYRIEKMLEGKDVSLVWECIDKVLQEPSVQPEPPEDICGECDAWNKYKSERKGKWIWDENGMDWGLGAWCCSECGSKPETWWESDKRNNPLRCAGGKFCGNCGARMDLEDES